MSVFNHSKTPAAKFKKEPIPEKPYRGPQKPPQAAASGKQIPPSAPGAGDIMPRGPHG